MVLLVQQVLLPLLVLALLNLHQLVLWVRLPQSVRLVLQVRQVQGVQEGQEDLQQEFSLEEHNILL
jgi:hypothetical protein